jgi:hypothetical protein
MQLELVEQLFEAGVLQLAPGTIAGGAAKSAITNPVTPL